MFSAFSCTRFSNLSFQFCLVFVIVESVQALLGGFFWVWRRACSHSEEVAEVMSMF